MPEDKKRGKRRFPRKAPSGAAAWPLPLPLLGDHQLRPRRRGRVGRQDRIADVGLLAGQRVQEGDDRVDLVFLELGAELLVNLVRPAVDFVDPSGLRQVGRVFPRFAGTFGAGVVVTAW